MRGLKLEKGRYGKRVVITAAWSEEMGQLIRRHGVVELDLNSAKGWRGTDLSFLATVPHLLSLQLTAHTITTVAPIHCLHELRTLELTTHCRNNVDFAAFPNLEACVLVEWAPGLESVFDRLTLRDLYVYNYRGPTAPFGRLVNLERLSLMVGGISEIDGLRALGKLRYLRLGGLNRLRSLNGLEGLVSLEQLWLQGCGHIGSIDKLSGLAQLRRVSLDDCGPIGSLRPLQDLAALERVSFIESTDIVDGDLACLERRPRVSLVYMGRPHYVHEPLGFRRLFSLRW